MTLRSILFVLIAFFVAAMGPWKGCEGATACTIEDRSYHIKLPDDWDGETAMPVLLHFHGWARQGDLIVKHRRISGHTRRRGVLLIAPNGNSRSWDFWYPGTDDVDFARAVLTEVIERYPVDTDQIYVSGYSWGSNMAWRFVCEDGADIAALLAISGTLDQDEDCTTAPREVRQVYGFNDNVLPFPYGPGGDEMHPVALWREKFGCGTAREEGAWQAVDFLKFDRFVWDNCADDHKVTLDLHPGGHFIPHGWIGWQLDQLMGREPQYP